MLLLEGVRPGFSALVQLSGLNQAVHGLDPLVLLGHVTEQE